MVNPVQISRDESLDAFGVYLEERDLWVYLCDPCFGKVFAERSKGYKRGGSLVERLEREIESRKAATGRCWPAPERRSRDPLVVLLQDALDQIRRQ